MDRLDEITSAIADDNVSAVRKLLKSDASLATRLIETPKLYDSGIFHWIYVGDTLLHLAAAGYRVEIVQLLLSAGSDPNAAKNKRKSTPLHYAADGFITGPAWDPEKQVETLRCLVKHGANIHSRDMNGATPLHRSVRTRCAAAVRFLLEAGSDATCNNKPGSTPFHLAVQNTGRGGSGLPAAIDAQREIVKEFLGRGVSLNLKDSKGKTVRDSIQGVALREFIEQHERR
jgi:ankyrin repeat protein